MFLDEVSPLSRPRFTFLLLSSILLTFFIASSAPTPLYRSYQELWGFNPVTLTVIFSVYTLGMLGALLVFGSISDYLGRKPVLMMAILIEVLAMVVFLCASQVEHLLIARFAQGCATGIATAVLGAYMLDVDMNKAAIANTIVPLIGMGLGVISSSLILDFGPMPMKLVYGIVTIFLLVQLLVLNILDEPVTRRRGALNILRPSLRVPAGARSMFFAILPMNTAVWALNGFFLSLVPSLVRLATPSKYATVGGVIVALMSFSGAIAVHLLKNRMPDKNIRFGGILLAGGVLGILWGVYSGVTTAFFVATMLAGFGAGASFISFTKSLLPLAAPGQRASLISSYYVVSQLSLIVPSVSLGILVQYVGLTTASYYFGAAVLVSLAVSALLMYTSRKAHSE
ncbi:MFS transporter [Pseudomonas mediterranea]|uniref:MFS transporter n=1 Tax=Pseudomonas mediterranea TaxID=183795 RepID=UPI0006D8B26A|nr:MFS transporter [Pseudomonas mediterranea]MDU9027497.1 MFS transporter [Pseudomonas mediterranea]